MDNTPITPCVLDTTEALTPGAASSPFAYGDLSNPFYNPTLGSLEPVRPGQRKVRLETLQAICHGARSPVPPTPIRLSRQNPDFATHPVVSQTPSTPLNNKTWIPPSSSTTTAWSNIEDNPFGSSSRAASRNAPSQDEGEDDIDNQTGHGNEHRRGDIGYCMEGRKGRQVTVADIKKVLPRFTGKAEDWPLWTARLKSALDPYGLRCYLEQVDRCPDPQAWHSDYIQDAAGNKLLYNLLLGVLDDDSEIIARAEAHEHGMHAYRLTGNRLLGVGSLRHRSLMTALLNTKWDTKQPIERYIADLKLIVHQLWSCGAPVSESQHMHALFNGLPPTAGLRIFIAQHQANPYATLATTIEELKIYVNSLQQQGRQASLSRDTTSSSSRSLVTAHQVRRPLVPAAMALADGTSIGEEVMAALSSVNKDTLDEMLLIAKAVNDRKCYICDQTGHLMRECPHKARIKAAAAVMQDEQQPTPFASDHDDEEITLVLYPEGEHVAATAVGQSSTVKFLIDSGGTTHVCQHRHLFSHYTSKNSTIRTANAGDSSLTAIGTGTIKVQVREAGGRCRTLHINNVLHCPGASFNILSVHQLKQKRAIVNFDKDVITTATNQTFPIVWNGRLPYLVTDTKTCNIRTSIPTVSACEEEDTVAALRAPPPARSAADDWQLARPVFTRLDQAWGPHTFDVFASEASRQTSAYYDKEHDALQQKWHASRLWINPPWKLLPQVINKIQIDKVLAPFTLIAPLWDVHYTQTLIEWSVTPPMVIPHDNNTFVRLAGSSTIRAPPPWQYTLAWNCQINASLDAPQLDSIRSAINEMLLTDQESTHVAAISKENQVSGGTDKTEENKVVEGRLHVPQNLLPKDRKLTPAECAVWHLKTSHCGYNRLAYLLRDVWPKDLRLPPCDACALGKAKLHAFPLEAEHRATQPGYRIHVDRAIMPIEGINGARVEFGVTDDASRLRDIYTRPDKSQSLLSLQKYVQHHGMPKAIRADQEIWTNEVLKWCRENQIKPEKTAPYHHQQNGVAERTWGVLHDLGRANLLWAEMPPEWWPYANKYACFVSNLLPSSANPQGKSPTQVYYGKLGKFHVLGPWGCKAFITIAPEKQANKLAPRAYEGIMLGPSRTHDACKFFVPTLAKVVISRHYRLTNIPGGKLLKSSPNIEDEVYHCPRSLTGPANPEGESPSSDNVQLKDDLISDQDSSNQSELIKEFNMSSDESVSNQKPSDEAPPTARRSRRLQGKPRVDYLEPDTKLIEQYLSCILDEQCNTSLHLEESIQAVDEGVDPNSYSHLYESVDEKRLTPALIKGMADSELWRKAQIREFNELTALKTWKIVKLPSGRRTIKHKWVFRRKFLESGKVDRYKARLVAKGFSQIYGVDYHETFSPVVRHETVRMFLAFCAHAERSVFQADIGNAYLNAPLDEEVYIDIPDGFRDYLLTKTAQLSTKAAVEQGIITKLEQEFLDCTSEKDTKDFVLLLLKGLPGLKQVGRNWFEMFAAWLRAHGFTQCPVDTCLFYTEDRNIIISTHVDDCMFGPKHEDIYTNLLKQLEADFKVASGKLSWFLGINVLQLSDGLYMNQSQYIENILKRFSMHESKPVCSPMVVGTNTRTLSDVPFDDLKLYRSAIGSLMHLAKWSRPDIAYAVAFCARAMAKPTEEAWTCVKRIFRYLRGTTHVQVVFPFRMTMDLVGYSDSDFANCPETRKSVSGFIFLLGNGRVPLSWKSGNQELVATSTLEAEYIALFTASQEALFLQRLIGYLLNKPTAVTPLKCDNTGAIALARNPEFHKRTKHIDVKFHAVRERQLKGNVDVSYIATAENLADAFTKPLAGKANDVPYLMTSSSGASNE